MIPDRSTSGSPSKDVVQNNWERVQASDGNISVNWSSQSSVMNNVKQAGTSTITLKSEYFEGDEIDVQ